jgi:hypothetical protein
MALRALPADDRDDGDRLEESGLSLGDEGLFCGRLLCGDAASSGRERCLRFANGLTRAGV